MVPGSAGKVRWCEPCASERRYAGFPSFPPGRIDFLTWRVNGKALARNVRIYRQPLPQAMRASAAAGAGRRERPVDEEESNERSRKISADGGYANFRRGRRFDISAPHRPSQRGLFEISGSSGDGDGSALVLREGRRAEPRGRLPAVDLTGPFERRAEARAGGKSCKRGKSAV